MPRISTKLAESKPFFAGLVGEIVGAEEIKTAVSGYNGVRCRIKGDDGIEYAEMLWVRAEVGPRSKIGAFLLAFGSDTDLWLHKRVRILKWEAKDRDIEEVPQKPVRRTTETITPSDVANVGDIIGDVISPTKKAGKKSA